MMFTSKHWAMALAFTIGAGLPLATTAQAQDDEEMDGVIALGASLFGENEVGGKGAGEDASGSFEGEIDMEEGVLCYFLEVEELDGFTAAHIHKGNEGKNGPPVVTLELASDEEVCTEVEADVLKAIAKDQEGYYVNVHTADYPAGAIRGQLGS